MTDAHRLALTESQLRRWADDLRGREEALAAERAEFQQHVRRWEKRAERLVTAKARDLATALEIVLGAFPGGLIFEARGPQPGVSVH